MNHQLLVLLPLARLDLAAELLAMGALPVVDHPPKDAALPPGVGVRVRHSGLAGGDGLVIAADGPALPGRSCWREATVPGPVPEGYAGLYLRGLGSGGAAGEEDVRRMTLRGAALLDWPHPPEEVVPAGAGIVLSDVLVGLLRPPVGLESRLARLKAGDIRTVRGLKVVASLGAPALQRLLAGEDPTSLGAELWTEGDAFEQLWLGGSGLLHATALARRPLAEVLAAYQKQLQAPAVAAAVLPAPVALPAGGEAAPDSGRPKIAVIGMGCRLPGAFSHSRLWEQLLVGYSAITEVPATRWDARLYWDADHSAPDRTYSKIGAFIEDFRFDPKRFRIPPSVARTMDPVQQLTLEAAYDAMADAGYGSDRSFDRERTAVILGNSMGGEITTSYTMRVMMPAMRQALEQGADFSRLPAEDRARIIGDYEARFRADLPVITEDSMPGELANVVAGRVANALNFGGPNFTTDAACASSMAAMEAAVKGLQDGDFDLALTGGADRSMGVPTYVKFSKIGALSPDGSRPFDAAANGFVMGEGAGIVLLKRLDDAIRDGDKIYAVIRGIGASSDGKGKGITAPNPDGQMRALQRAYQDADLDPREVQLFECHGTSTVVGDKVEVECLSKLVGSRGSRGPARIGSIKSNIGHLKSGAGAASLLKATLAIHHGMLPPSINYRTARADLPLDVVPLQVQTQPEAWTGPRYAGVSAFGFGGTNFHMVLEQYRPGMSGGGRRPSAVTHSRVTSQVKGESLRLPQQLWGLTAGTAEELRDKALALKEGKPSPYQPDAPLRLVAVAESPEERDGQIEKVVAAIQKAKGYELLRQRGIALEDEPCNGKLALLFTGQGSQYLDMGMDLAAVFPVVAKTFAEADAVMTPILGRPLTDYIRRDPALSEEAAFEALVATEIAQPATLTMDVAMMRLLADFGVEGDVVAGHSLGEYGAAVAAGIISFPQALLAVSARGREMAAVQIDDRGKMASISTSLDNVQQVLAGVSGYVIAANKNCPSQTVIAGASDAVDAACEAFRAKGHTVAMVPVSHAFHSAIVAPASEPLRRVLERLDIRPPTKKITSNVTGDYYPTGDDARAAVIDLLAQQVAAPVEWIAQIERMHRDGVRIFVECGPKRALSSFVTATLKRVPHRALSTNHPKRGGLLSFLDTLAALVALGFPVRIPGDTEASTSRRATTAAIEAWKARAASSLPEGAVPEVAPVAPPAAPPVAAVPAAPPGSVHSLLGQLAEQEIPGVDSAAFATAMEAPLRAFLHAAGAALVRSRPAASAPVRVVCSGASVGLPGGDEVFEPDGIQRILRGENRIRKLKSGEIDRFLDKGLVRLEKDPQTGEGHLELVERADQVIRLAGVKSHFSIADYGVEPEMARALDITTQLAFAAGLEALKDAGIPLVLRWRTTTNGKQVPNGWGLPASMQDDTGVVFASAFPGYDQLIQKLKHNGDDGEGHFDRRFLFQVLSMGHSQFAQLIGARGPNTAVNAACASTTQAISIAEDWLRTGRARRVVVVAADDVTGDSLLEWIGSGFLAAGAAATDDKVEDAALPFDRRRHGLLLGMGAVGMVLEREEEVAARGMEPVAELLASRVANSAFHGTRLDAEHIAATVRSFVADAVEAAGVSHAAFARRAVFMSHETFTPARGGSAAAEMAALPAAFGPAASEILIANTKGFTGHAMGAGLEDAVAVKMLQYRQVPPIPNLKEPDPQLGSLRLSKGGHADIDYAIRLSAGFGSQLALLAWKRRAAGDRRIAEPLAHARWLGEMGRGRLQVEHRQLRYVVELEPKVAAPVVEAPAVAVAASPVSPPVGAVAAPVPAPAAPAAAPCPTFAGDPLELLRSIIAEKTGYDVAEIDPDYELEADLGIDTVKQAEIFSVVRERLSLARDDNFRLSDYRTVRRLGEWLASQVTTSAGVIVTEPAEVSDSSAINVQPVVVEQVDTLALLQKIIAEKTGYDVAEVDPDYELEADLGIDTVKQAEIFSVVRERLSLGRDDSFRLSDYRTVRALAGWLAAQRPVVAPPVAPAPPVIHLPVAHQMEATTSVDPPTPAAAPTLVPPSAPTEAPTLVPTAHETPAATSTSTTSALDVLVAVIAEKTGYDVSEVDPDYELEADLGVDTVKQAEIFSVVRERLSLARDDSFRLSDYRTVRMLAAWMEQARAHAAPRPVADLPGELLAVPTPRVVLSILAGTPTTERAGVPSSPSDTSAVSDTSAASDTSIPAGPPAPIVPLVRVVPPISDDTAEWDLEETTHDVSEIQQMLADTPATASPVELLPETSSDRLPRLSALPPSPVLPPVTLPPVAGGSLLPHVEEATVLAGAPTPPPRVVHDTLVPVESDKALPESFRLRRLVRMARPLPHRHRPLPPIQVLGDGPLAELLLRQIETFPGGTDLEAPMVVIDTGLPVLECFATAKMLAHRCPRWICLQVEEESSSLGPAREAGARAGLARALGKEWGSESQVIRLDPALSLPEAATRVLMELQLREAPVELWLGPDRREVGVLETIAIPSSTPWRGVPVVLLTGGTRGITAEVAREMARRGPCTLILVGRTAPLDHPLVESVEKNRIKTDLSRRVSPVTPKMVQDAMAPLRAADEVRRTMAELRSLGAMVEFRQVDVGVRRSIEGLLRDVLDHYGRLDIVVHGAGLEESRRLEDKTVADFRRVYAAKAEGGLALAELLPAGTHFVSMGSVAGFFGNAGQVDYAAANAAMAAVCEQRPWSLHVAWTAWAGTGMAVRGGMESLLQGRGVELLPAEAGAALLVDLIGAGVSGEVLAAGKLGDFRLRSWHPLLDDVGYDGDTGVGWRRMSLQRDPWLADHAIAGTPVLPGVIGLELMAAAALVAYPKGHYLGAEDVLFNAPLKLHRDEPVEVEVRATPLGDGVFQCTLSSRRTAKTGRLLVTEHFSARIHLEDTPLLADLPAAFLPEEPIESAEIYRRFFHGPRFQVLLGVEALAVQGIQAVGRVDHRPIADALLSAPLVLEAGMQAAGLHRMVFEEMLALPAEIGAISLLKENLEMENLTITVWKRGEVYDIDVDDVEGQVLRVRGFRMIDLGPLADGGRFAPPEGGWASVGVASAAEGNLLPDVEKEALGSRGLPRRRADRQAGQLAGLRALAPWGGGRLRRDAAGAPVVEDTDLGLSLSHQDGRALAVVMPQARVGVDMEQVCRRDPAFRREWFTEEEWPLVAEDQSLTAAWAIKEAVLKALGVGLKMSPREVLLRGWSPLRVELCGEVAARHQSLGGAPLRVRRGRLGTQIIALASFRRRI